LKRLAALVLAVASALAVACAPSGSSKKAFTSDVHMEAELMEADRSFARDTSDRGIDGWVDAFTDDGVQLPSGEPLARGKAAIRNVMVALLSDPTSKLRWDPDRAQVSSSGDLGYTLGRATVSKVGPSGGELVVAKLKYLSVWKRQADGHWKVAVDVGTPEP
jgi:ketosteroid isomerase-like protein